MQSPITSKPPLCLLLCWHPGPGHHHLSLRLTPALPASFPTPRDGLQPLTPTRSPHSPQSDLKCHQSLSFPGFPSHFSWKPASLPQSQGSLYRCHFYPNASPRIQATCSLRCLKELLYMQTPQPSNSITCLYRTETYTRILQMLCSRVFTAALLTAKSTVSIRMDR